MTPVQRAKADLAKMEGEVARLQAQLATTQSRIADVRAYIKMAAVYESDDGHTEAVRTRGGVSATAVRMAVDMIVERSAPMHTREILRELQARGVVVGGNNPVANLSGFLSRADELRNSRADGWGLAQWGAPLDEEKGDEAQEKEDADDNGLQSLSDR